MATNSKQYDLTSALSPYMDLHFMFPLLDFLSSNGLYPEKELMAAKLELLAPTNMADFASEIYQQLNETESVPAEYEERRNRILADLSYGKEACLPMLEMIEDGEEMMRLQNEKLLTINYLEENHGITSEILEHFYKYAKLQYECGNYQDSLTYLTYYGALMPNSSDQYLNALWGKLASEILLFRWEDALDDISRLLDAIDNRNSTYPLEQLQQRTWLLHWSLFVFAWHTEGRDAIVEIMMQSRCLEAIQINAPWMMRYLCAGVMMHKKRRNLLREFLKALQLDDPESSYHDPIVMFVESLVVDFDFDKGQEILGECEIILANDFFLYDKNYKDFMDSARLMIFEVYCRIHEKVDIKLLSKKLGMSMDSEERVDTEKWIVDLVRNARLDHAKIDSKEDFIHIGVQYKSVYQQVIDKTKDLTARTCNMMVHFEKLGKKSNNNNHHHNRHHHHSKQNNVDRRQRF